MAKTIIKKEVTEYGSIELSFFKKDESYAESMRFDNELQLKAFAYLQKTMLETDAATVEIG
jgi:hypothetical protein